MPKITPAPLRRPAVKARAASRKMNSAVGGVVAPLGIVGAAMVAANEARQQGSSVGDAVAMDVLDTAKSFAVFGGAHAAVSAAVMKGARVAHAAGVTAKVGMTVGKASGIASLALSAYGAADGAMTARKEGKSMLAGAAKGAWDYSLPGMLWDGMKDTYSGIQGYREAQRQEAEAFNKANQVWQSPRKTASSGDTFQRTRRDPRSGKSITETVRKARRANPDWDIGIDPKKSSADDED